MNLSLSYNWIKEYLKTNKSVEEFVKEFSLRSQTIDRFRPIRPPFRNVITAKILEINPHPNADRLRLATVDTGQGKQTVVCGAPNIAVGQVVPLARVGAQVIDQDGTTFEIKKAKIRDIESDGMICSPRELGLGEDHSGIMVLPSDTKIGKKFEEVFDFDDYVLDIEVTSNRTDAMSVVGLARDAAAVLGGTFLTKLAEPKLKSVHDLPLGINVKESKLCPRYNAVVMTNITVGPSPLWMQLRLIAAGMRPINNLVDITNYILLEYGRPMHVFDYDKISGQEIIVRLAKKGETVLALDGQTYQLQPNHLVIADSQRAVAIAGVMGGADSAAYENTKTIIFESATFDPLATRKTARELNLHSASSDLFEKNLHPESTFVGILRAIELTQALAGGQVASPIVDIYDQPYKPKKIELDLTDVKRYLGVELKPSEIKNILTNLGFEVSGSARFKVIVPWYRAYDVTASHDLIEEIARVYGYHKLPVSLPSGQVPVEVKDPIFYWEKKVKNCLSGLGFSEVYNYSMVSEKLLATMGYSSAPAVKIDNPLNEDMVYMRNTLLPQMLQNVSDNLNNYQTQKIFELSNIYIPAKTNDLPKELLKLTAAVVDEQSAVFSLAKGTTEFLLKKMGITNYTFKSTDDNCPIWEAGRCLDVYLGEEFLGQFGIPKAEIRERFGINRGVALVDFNFQLLTAHAKAENIFEPLPEFPSATRDMAIIVDQGVAWGDVFAKVSGIDNLIVSVNYLSTFVNQNIGDGKKSLAFRLTFRSPERTLKSEEIDRVLLAVEKKLVQLFGAQIRK
ncbi:MAG: phenylalanine--tRNA ligase subunit beta [Candidatus Buchananbacteria bacterium]|nr:phenylalanine--tRNA ligase subunit beta [Candidatus Buchananbacteria bacterium]